MSLLGIDLGTSGVRAAVFNVKGEEIASFAVSVPVTTTAGGLVESDAELMLVCVEHALRQVNSVDEVVLDPVVALAISAQGEAIVPVDISGRALALAPLSMDRRGATVSSQMTERIGADRIARITGQPAHPMFSIYKVAAGDSAWRSAAGFRCLGDFVAARLGAEPAIDYSMAARTGAFDIDSLAWSDEIFGPAADLVGKWLEKSKFSVAVPSGMTIGKVSSEAAARTGLRTGTRIVAGSHDQASSYIGAGGHEGEASVFAFGSSDCLAVGSTQRPNHLDHTGIASYPLAEGMWITLAGTAAGGWSLAWFANLVGAGETDDMDELFANPATVPPRLIVLPYFAGSGTLDNDPAAHGVIAGLTLSTSNADLSRAFLESSGFELAKILDAFTANGISVGEIRAVGGGVRNRTALTIRADAAGIPLTGVAGHVSARGAALTAGIGAGVFKSFGALPEPQVDDVAQPSSHNQSWYQSQRETFRELYLATKSINVALSTK